MTLIQGTHHISLRPCGGTMFDKTVSFYCDILQLKVVRSWGAGENRGVMLSTGNSLLEITSNGTSISNDPGNIHHFALTTQHVDKLIQAVRDAGYSVTMEPTDVAIPSEPPMPARVAFCVGPVGEAIEFFMEK